MDLEVFQDFATILEPLEALTHLQLITIRFIDLENVFQIFFEIFEFFTLWKCFRPFEKVPGAIETSTHLQTITMQFPNLKNVFLIFSKILDLEPLEAFQAFGTIPEPLKAFTHL